MRAGFVIFPFENFLLILLTLLIISGCNSGKQVKREETFDSLVQVLNARLKTNSDSALKVSEELNRIANTSGEDTLLYTAALLRGKAFQNAMKNDSALSYYRKMRFLAFKLNDTLRILQTCNTLGTLFVEIGSNDSVGFWYRKGLMLARAAGDSSYLAGFSANTGLFYSRNGQSDSAMKCFSEAARYYENRSELENSAQIYRNIGNLFLGQGQYAKANEYYNRAISFNRKAGNIFESGTDLTNLAVSHMMMGSDSAQFYYQEALKIMTDYGNINNLMPIKFNYANYLKDLGKLVEAEKSYNEVLQISRENDIIQGQMYSLNQLGLIETIRKNSSKANAHFKEAILLAQQNKLNADLVLFYREAFEGNMQLRNIDPALEYFKKWDRLNDSLMTISREDAVLKYQALYEKQVLESKIIALNAHVRLQKSRNIIIALTSLALLLLVSTLVIFLFFRKRQSDQKRKLAEQQALQSKQEMMLKQTELEKKTLEHQLKEEEVERLGLEVNLREQELVYQSLIATRLNQVNQSVQEKLGQFQYRFPKKSDQTEFGQLVSEIMRDASRNPMNDFEVVFKQIHSGFYEKLLALSPDLTRSELQVCALLRLNLSSKGIAGIANLSPATVVITRHHIRKKLNLDPKESLTSYLIQL